MWSKFCFMNRLYMIPNFQSHQWYSTTMTHLKRFYNNSAVIFCRFIIYRAKYQTLDSGTITDIHLKKFFTQAFRKTRSVLIRARYNLLFAGGQNVYSRYERDVFMTVNGIQLLLIIIRDLCNILFSLEVDVIF